MKKIAAVGLFLAIGITSTEAGDRWAGFTVAAGFGAGRLGLSTSSTYAQTSVFDSTNVGQSCDPFVCQNFTTQYHEDYRENVQTGATGSGEWNANTGLSFGYAKQWSSMVLGVEAGAAWVDYSTTARGPYRELTYQHQHSAESDNGGPYYAVQDDTNTQTNSTTNGNTASGSASSLLTFNGKLGFEIMPGILLYATGGGARGKFEDLPFENRWGWLYGGGAEIAVTDSWSFRTEYRRIDFADYNSSVHGDDLFSGPGYSQTIVQDSSSQTSVTIEEIRLSLAYRFSK